MNWADFFCYGNTLLCALIVLKHKGHYLNISLISYFLIFIFCYIGSIISLSDNSWWLQNISKKNIKLGYYYFNLCFFIYGFIVLLLPKFNNKLVIAKPKNIGIEKYLFTILLILSFFVTLLFLFPSSALKELLSNPSADTFLLAELRASMGVNFEGPKLLTYFQNIIIRFFIPFIFCYYYIYYIQYNKYKYHALISFIILLFCTSLTLEKTPIVHLVFFVALIRFNFKKINIIKYFLVTATLVVALYIFVMGAGTTDDVITSLSGRLFEAQYYGFPTALEVFPVIHDFLGIRGISGFVSALFSVENISYSRVTMEYVNPNGVAAGISGFMSTIFFAEAYSIGGVPLMIISAITVPITLAFLDYFFRKKNSIFSSSFYLILVIKVPFIIIVGWVNIFLNVGLILLALFIFTIRQINKALLIKKE